LYYITNNVALLRDNYDISEFPDKINLDELIEKNHLRVKRDYFNYLIETTKLYVGDDELRPVLMGVNFKYDGNDFYLSSTNANYLCRIKVEEDIVYESKNEFNFILPIYNITDILNSNDDEFIDLYVYKNKQDDITIKLTTSSSNLIQKCIYGKYPNYDSVIPKYNNKEIRLNKKEILNSLKSKEVESFLKRNKKLQINISGEQDGDKLLIKLYSTYNLRTNLEIKETINILVSSLNLKEDSIETTNTCLLLMPMINERENLLFAFSLQLFKKYIQPVNTEDFKIIFSEKNRAYIINEEFFKYNESNKKTTKNNFPKQTKQIITKIEKKELKTEEKSDIDFLNELLIVSNDLLDLVLETGDSEDVNFLKEKIKATKDLLSLLIE